jgi:glucose-1-phosphate adenylyltransferase
VRGRVVRSVLGPGTVVQAGAVVEDSVLFGDVVVEAGAEVRTCIVDDDVVIGRGARVGAVAPSNRPRDKDITLIARDSRIARNAVVEAGARLEPGTRA